MNLAPPKIFYSRQPAILVTFLGKPQFKPVAANRTDLTFALNTNWDLFYDTASQRYFLLNLGTWLTAADVNGPSTPHTGPARLAQFIACRRQLGCCAREYPCQAP